MSTPLQYAQRITDPQVNREFWRLVDAINSLQSRLDAINAGAGLTVEGSLTAGHFLLAAGATALKDAGFGAGFTGTVVLAKITGGGTDGSLTIANGLITAVTAPT